MHFKCVLEGPGLDLCILKCVPDGPQLDLYIYVSQEALGWIFAFHVSRQALRWISCASLCASEG